MFHPHNAPIGVTLSEQKRVAEEVRVRTQDETFVLIKHAELLFLMHRVNPLPVTYWNSAAYSYFGDAPNEGFLEAAMRLLLSVEPEASVWTLRTPMLRGLREEFTPHLVGSESNGYSILLMVRRPAPAHP